jgi:hypothetical protein
MAAIQPISVTHQEKGQGIVVDRLSHYDTEKGGFIVQLGVAFYEHPVPAVHYHSPDELEQNQVLDFPSDDFEDEDEEGEDEEGEEGDPA